MDGMCGGRGGLLDGVGGSWWWLSEMRLKKRGVDKRRELLREGERGEGMWSVKRDILKARHGATISVIRA